MNTEPTSPAAGPAPPPRFAAIDVGTNTIRLVVVEAEPEGGYRILDEERAMVRLGLGLQERGRLDPAAMTRALDAIGKMKGIADGRGVTELRAVATSAVREAANGPDFRREARRRHGVRIDVIPAEEEARYAFQSAARHFELDGRSTAVADIGGGSLEVVFAAGTVVDRVHSLALGAVRLTERYVKSDPLRGKHWKKLSRAIERAIERGIGRPPFRVDALIGSGGTFATMAEMIQADRDGGGASVQGFTLTLTEVERLLWRLLDTTLDARRHMPGLNPRRADIILAGVAVIARLAEHLRCRQILVNDGGIRDGLILSMLAEHFGAPATAPAPLDRLEGVRRFARRCRSNERHCEHVAFLALAMFDGLREPFALPQEGRPLLEAAGLVLDVGYLISHAGHHKHAYHLIMHGELPGFSVREIELIANIVRYQRRAFPKKTHVNFARLSRGDRRMVRALAAILRIANGLDRAHARRVTRVRTLVDPGRVRLLVDADGDPEVEIWDARRRAALFEKVFGVTLDIRRAALRGLSRAARNERSA